MIDGRTILLTGGSRGIGRALTEKLASSNRIVTLSRHGDGLAHPNVTNKPCDLADSGEVTSVVDEVCREFPKIDVLINNAAVLTSRPVAMMADDDIAAQVQVNLLAPILITKRVVKRMISRRGGRVVNIISMSHKLNQPGDSVYAATKAGLETFGKIVNAEAHPFGVTVNAIAVSAVETGMLAEVTKDAPEKIRDLIPHRSFADIDDVLNVFGFFCADSSADIGGQTVCLGGV